MFKFTGLRNQTRGRYDWGLEQLNFSFILSFRRSMVSSGNVNKIEILYILEQCHRFTIAWNGKWNTIVQGLLYIILGCFNRSNPIECALRKWSKKYGAFNWVYLLLSKIHTYPMCTAKSKYWNTFKIKVTKIHCHR